MARTMMPRLRGRFEVLEQKALLAGDVLVNVTGGGNLTIQGDDSDNKIMITAGAEAGAFVVTGLDGTTVTLDGTTSGEATVSGVRRIHLDLGDGDDLAAVVGAEVDGSLSIHTGGGNDRVLVGTGGDADELAGVLPDDLSVNVNGSLRIHTSDGDDLVSVEDASVSGRLSVNVGDGDDEVAVVGADVGIEAMGLGLGRGLGRLSMLGGLFGHAGVDVNLGDGNDTLNLNDVEAHGSIAVHAGAGDDTVDASQTTSAKLMVLGGDGIDSIVLDSIDAGRLGIHTGDGDDNVEIRDSVFASLGVSLGDGDDTLATAALTARTALLLGGDGEDTLELEVEGDIELELIRGFEIPPDINVLPPVRRVLGRVLGALR